MCLVQISVETSHVITMESLTSAAAACSSQAYAGLLSRGVWQNVTESSDWSCVSYSFPPL